VAEASPRVQIGNLRSGDIFSAQFNPEQIERQIDVNYTRLGVLGMSHEVLQYQFRQNEKLKFTLYFDARSTEQGDQATAEKYLDALTLSSREARDIAGGGPPDALFLWPGLLSMRTRVTQLKYTYKRFAPTGERVYFMVDVQLEEARDTRLYAEDVLKHGLQRF
jgi:hypothetical protein